MLMQMRKGARSWVAKIFLCVVALSFVAWGIGDVFRGNSATTVADVGSAQIGSNQLAQAYSTQTRNLAQSGVGVEPGSELAGVLVNVVLNELIDQAIYDQEAASFGITIGTETIAEAIGTNPAFQDQSGQFSPQMFPIALANIGMSEGQYVASLRRQLTSAQLIDSIMSGPPLPATLINNLFAYRYEKRTAEIVVVPNELLAGISDPTAGDLDRYYEDHEPDYRAPEYRSAEFVTIYPEDLAAGMIIAEEVLREEYEATAGRWITPELRSLQQIGFESEDQALAAYDKLITGTDFIDVAADAGRDEAMINMGTVARNDMLPGLADQVFALSEGAFSEPVQSPLGGWLIFKVTAVEPGTTQSFADAREELQQMVALDRAHDTMFDLAYELDDLLVAGDTLRQAAATLGLRVNTIELVDAEGNLADPMSMQIVPSDPEFLTELFIAEPNLPSPVIETNAGGLTVVEVTEIRESRMLGLDEVRDQVLADWRLSHQADVAAATAQALVDGADATTALADLEELTGFSATGTETLLRGDVPEIAGADMTLVAALFNAKSGETVITPTADRSGQVLARLVSIETPDPALDPDALSPMTASVAGGNRQAMTDQHLAYLRQAYDIVINHELIAQRF